MFSEIVTAAGASVDTADGAAAALALLTERRPEVIVRDIAMPGEDGYVFLRKVRGHADRRVAEIPAVAVTAHARAEDRRNALAAGYQRYIAKPVSPQSLVATIAALRPDHRVRR